MTIKPLLIGESHVEKKFGKKINDLQFGDIIKINFSPTKGHEQIGYRPALVLTNPKTQVMLGGMTSVAPITSTKRGFPLHIPLDARTTTQGVVMIDQHKMLDLNDQPFKYVEKLPDDLLGRCKEMHKALYEDLLNH